MSGILSERKTTDFIGSHEKIRPLRDRILVKIIPLKLGVLIDADFRGSVRGEVISVGPGTYPNIRTQGWRDGKQWQDIRQSKAIRPTEVKPGDIVQLDGMRRDGSIRQFPKVYIEHQEHVIVQESDIAGIEIG